LGIGAEFQLNAEAVGGLSANYDTGLFHVGGFFGMNDPAGGNNTRIDIGGRFYYHLAATASSDFSVGGSLGIESVQNGVNNSATNVFIEPGFQIRAFIATNVALSFSGGISIGAADTSGIRITGDFNGTAGVHYYF
jgi:hypothetical protein